LNEKLDLKDDRIEWVSPCADKNFAEYRDDDFLEVLGLNHLIHELKDFWPKNGPQWDGLGKDSNNIYLIEAKANIPEIKSPPCGAKSDISRSKIHNALENTKQYISDDTIMSEWTNSYYQYTNRLAHLYFLRSKGIKAYLLFIYFVGDKAVNGPETVSEWKKAIQKMKEELQIPPLHRLSDYIIDIFINVDDIFE
jgi:hypothetical protein